MSLVQVQPEPPNKQSNMNKHTKKALITTLLILPISTLLYMMFSLTGEFLLFGRFHEFYHIVIFCWLILIIFGMLLSIVNFRISRYQKAHPNLIQLSHSERIILHLPLILPSSTLFYSLFISLLERSS